MITCKNCNAEFEGNFCNQCGQTAKVQRLDWHYFKHNVQHSVFHLDQGILYTAKQFFLNPGNAAKEFFSGKRLKYTGPIAYFALVTVLFYVVTKFLSTETIQEDKVTKYIEEYYAKVLLFIIIPLYVLLTNLFFRKNDYNFYELFAFHCYMQVQFMLIEMVVTFIDWSLVHFYIFLHPYSVIAIKLGVEVLFMSWAFMQLFNKKNFLACFVKTFLITAVMVIVYAALIAAVSRIL